MTIDQILDYKLLKLLGEAKYNLVLPQDKNFILAQAKSKIQLYCHRKDMPKEIFYIWADMAIEILKSLDSSLFSEAEAEELMDRVTTVKAGDTTLSFSEADGLKNNLERDNILHSFSRQLQNFRKVVKGNGSGIDGV